LRKDNDKIGLRGQNTRPCGATFFAKEGKVFTVLFSSALFCKSNTNRISAKSRLCQCGLDPQSPSWRREIAGQARNDGTEGFFAEEGWKRGK
jgi:hypothetical protein